MIVCLRIQCNNINLAYIFLTLSSIWFHICSYVVQRFLHIYKRKSKVTSIFLILFDMMTYQTIFLQQLSLLMKLLPGVLEKLCMFCQLELEWLHQCNGIEQWASEAWSSSQSMVLTIKTTGLEDNDVVIVLTMAPIPDTCAL